MPRYAFFDTDVRERFAEAVRQRNVDFVLDEHADEHLLIVADNLEPDLIEALDEAYNDIMAAGMGSRYGGLKQMDPVGPNGETLLEYSIHDAIAAGFGKIVFVIRSDFEAEFKEQVGSRFADKIEVQYAFQSLENLPAGFSIPEGRTKPWGAGQAVLAGKELGEPYLQGVLMPLYGSLVL